MEYVNLPSKGFSLLELMVALSMIVIISMIAIPATSRYMTQSRVADALAGTSDLQVKIALRIAANETVTDSGNGFTTPTNLGRHVAGFAVSDDGVISLTTSADAGGVSLTLTPVYNSSGDEVTWVCQVSSSALNDYVPKSCRVTD